MAAQARMRFAVQNLRHADPSWALVSILLIEVCDAETRDISVASTKQGQAREIGL